MENFGNNYEGIDQDLLFDGFDNFDSLMSAHLADSERYAQQTDVFQNNLLNNNGYMNMPLYPQDFSMRQNVNYNTQRNDLNLLASNGNYPMMAMNPQIFNQQFLQQQPFQQPQQFLLQPQYLENQQPPVSNFRQIKPSGKSGNKEKSFKLQNTQVLSNKHDIPIPQSNETSNNKGGKSKARVSKSLSSSSIAANNIMSNIPSSSSVNLSGLISSSSSVISNNIKRQKTAQQNEEDIDDDDHDDDKTFVRLAKEKRRERNKVLARKTRVKKKFELENLREQAAALHKENEVLKKIVRNRLPPPLSVNILMNCEVELPDIVNSVINGLSQQMEINQLILMKKISASQKSFCISNAKAHDFPIVYASKGFCELTGYSFHEIVGRNCRFLQGLETDKAEVTRIGVLIRGGYEGFGVLKNYRKDGTPFWNFIQFAPLKNINGEITMHVALQCEVSSPFLDEQEAEESQCSQLDDDFRSNRNNSKQQQQQHQHIFTNANSLTDSKALHSATAHATQPYIDSYNRNHNTGTKGGTVSFNGTNGGRRERSGARSTVSSQTGSSGSAHTNHEDSSGNTSNGSDTNSNTNSGSGSGSGSGNGSVDDSNSNNNSANGSDSGSGSRSGSQNGDQQEQCEQEIQEQDDLNNGRNSYLEWSHHHHHHNSNNKLNNDDVFNRNDDGNSINNYGQQHNDAFGFSCSAYSSSKDDSNSNDKADDSDES